MHSKTVSDPHGQLSVVRGSGLTLVFRVQPGVGYGWTLSSVSRRSVLRPTGDTLVPDPGTGVGGPEHERFGFQALKAGKATLVFRHSYRGRLLEKRRVVVKVTG